MISSIDINLCERFLQVRKYKGFTQKQFADDLDLRQSYVSEIENHRAEPSKKTIIQIIRKYDIDARWLLLGDGEMQAAHDPVRVKDSTADYKNSVLLKKLQELESENENLRAFILRIATKPPE